MAKDHFITVVEYTFRSILHLTLEINLKHFESIIFSLSELHKKKRDVFVGMMFV